MQEPTTATGLPRSQDPNFWPSVLTRLSTGESLSAEEAALAMVAIMDGNATPAQVGGFLMALRTKGETVDEIDGLSRTALEMARPVTTRGPVVDTCGTGGDRSETFNISTLAAIVVAGAGVPVAKHGNRAASSHCGSADLLEALGVRIDLGPEGVEHCLADAGIAFMFAPVFHPGAAHAAPVRRELRVPTVFNFLGPLTNPARPGAQVVGVSDPRMLPLVAQVLARRGIRAKVFRGHDGLDELTVTGSSTVYETANGDVREQMLDPGDLGFSRARAADLKGGDAETNAEIARRLLEGESGPRRDVVLLNAGAALEVAGRAGNPMDGIAVARESIDSGAAAAALERWVEVSQKVTA
jgi:anthranilate phosphoribosyltransferase